MKKLLYPMPVYVTNKAANGDIATYTLPLVATLLLLILFLVNSIGWGIYGVVELVSKVV